MRIIVPVFIAGVCILIAVFYFSRQTSGVVSNRQPIAELVTVPANLHQDDADSDGLKDWEEALWKTNPNRQDTDGDGMADGAEVKANRNPALAGPNDAMGTTLSATASSTVMSSSTESLTDQFARNIFSQYLSFKQAGIPLADIKDKVTQSALANIEGEVTYDLFTASDVTVVADSQEALRAYANAAGKLVLAYSNDGSEILILREVLISKDRAAVAKFDPLVSKLGKLTQGLRALPVPQSILQQHLALLNSYAKLQADVAAMRNLYDDPVVTMVRLSKYQQNTQTLAEAYKAIGTFFSLRGFQFSRDEDGQVFSRSI